MCAGILMEMPWGDLLRRRLSMKPDRNQAGKHFDLGLDSLQDQEKINFPCSNHLVSDNFLWQFMRQNGMPIFGFLRKMSGVHVDNKAAYSLKNWCHTGINFTLWKTKAVFTHLC